jgi:hypothetical protein
MMMERDVEMKHEPLLVTNTRGQFVLSRRTRDGKGRYGFFECPLEDEAKLLPVLYTTLLTYCRTPGWPTPVPSVAAALDRLPMARSIVLSSSLISSICGEGFTPEQVATLMKVQGHVAIVNGIQVLAGELPENSAIVSVEPASLGVYTRVGDYLGLQLFDVRQTLVVVRPDGMVG